MKAEPLTNDFLISLACPWAAQHHFDGCDQDHEDRERDAIEQDEHSTDEVQANQ